MTRRYVVDVLERAGATFGEAFLMLWLAAGTPLAADLSTLRAAALSGLVAAASVIKSALARFIRDRESASLLE